MAQRRRNSEPKIPKELTTVLEAEPDLGGGGGGPPMFNAGDELECFFGGRHEIDSNTHAAFHFDPVDGRGLRTAILSTGKKTPGPKAMLTLAMRLAGFDDKDEFTKWDEGAHFLAAILDQDVPGEPSEEVQQAIDDVFGTDDEGTGRCATVMVKTRRGNDVIDKETGEPKQRNGEDDYFRNYYFDAVQTEDE